VKPGEQFRKLKLGRKGCNGLQLLLKGWCGGMGSGKQGFHKPMGFHVQAIFGMDRFHGRQLA